MRERQLEALRSARDRVAASWGRLALHQELASTQRHRRGGVTHPALQRQDRPVVRVGAQPSTDRSTGAANAPLCGLDGALHGRYLPMATASPHYPRTSTHLTPRRTAATELSRSRVAEVDLAGARYARYGANRSRARASSIGATARHTRGARRDVFAGCAEISASSSPTVDV
jgi:hypothetical protein